MRVRCAPCVCESACARPHLPSPFVPLPSTLHPSPTADPFVPPFLSFLSARREPLDGPSWESARFQPKSARFQPERADFGLIWAKKQTSQPKNSPQTLFVESFVYMCQP